MVWYDSDLDKIAEMIDLKELDLLEVGCGDGRLTAEMAPLAKSISALDPDAALIARAQRSCPEIDFQVGSGECLAFQPKRFDVVLFTYSLHHQACQPALAEARRVLRPNGRILVLEPSADGEYSQLVAVFDPSELHRLRKTLNFLETGDHQVLKRDSYHMRYTYSDVADLCSHFKSKFMEREDPQAEIKMRDVIGDRTGASPVAIYDTVNIFLI